MSKPRAATAKDRGKAYRIRRRGAAVTTEQQAWLAVYLAARDAYAYSRPVTMSTIASALHIAKWAARFVAPPGAKLRMRTTYDETDDLWGQTVRVEVAWSRLSTAPEHVFPPALSIEADGRLANIHARVSDGDAEVWTSLVPLSEPWTNLQGDLYTNVRDLDKRVSPKISRLDRDEPWGIDRISVQVSPDRRED